MRHIHTFKVLPVITAALLWIAPACLANVRLPEVFTSGMCLQRDVKLPIWGTAAPGEKITVRLCGQQLETTAAPDGAWRVDLAPVKAGGPFDMTVAGNNTLTFNNVYVGDVWLCYGQSNMQWSVGLSTTGAEALKESTPEIRLLHVHQPWATAEGTPLQNFSAIGYYFGRSLYKKLKIPIGLIYGGEGGTPAEVWTPLEELKALGYGGDALNNIFYTDRVKPLEPYAIKGCIWYQGENNVGNAAPYTALMTGLIEGWRKGFQQPDFPFLFVQLARIGGEPTKIAPIPTDGWAQLRDAQTRTLSVPNTGMVVCFDTTNGNIHPPFKQPVGERLAMLAGAMVYGEKPTDNYTCPLFKEAHRHGNTVVLSFSNASNGLMLQNGKLLPDGSFTYSPALTIADLFLVHPDGSFVPARARIVKNTVVVDITGETGLPDLYYAWSNYPMGNIYNKAGLPLSPFRVVSPQLGVEQCSGHQIVISANQALNSNVASDPNSYQVIGAKVIKASLMADGMTVDLTTNTAWILGQSVTVKLPGFKQWDAVTPVADLNFTVLPGQLATGGLIKELLIGETQQNIDFATVLQDPKIDVSTFSPVEGAVWKRVHTDDGLFDLTRWVGPYQNAVTFGYTNIYSDANRMVQIWTGSDDGIKVYVNGQAVYTMNQPRGLSPDQDKTTGVALKKGWNTLLLEVSQLGGGWGVCARIMDDKGQSGATGVSTSVVTTVP